MNKFKVWCHNYSEWEEHTCVLYPNGVLGQLKESGIIPCKLDTHTVVFYTGINDKIGTEIYDRDVLLADGKDILEVRFRDGCFIWINVKTKMWRPLYDYHSSRIKIIGNSLESPINSFLEPTH